MTLKDFTNTHDISGFEIIGNLIISTISNNISYALDVDTSDVPFGTPVIIKTEFSISEDILSIDEIHININNIDLIDTHTI
jgi:hypothetical protein